MAYFLLPPTKGSEKLKINENFITSGYLTNGPVSKSRHLNGHGPQHKEAPFKVFETNSDYMTDEKNYMDSRNINLQEGDSKIEAWQHRDYYFDPNNPRKPNMREMIESLSGFTLEDLISNKTEEFEEFSKKSSELLYGVLDSEYDPRQWAKIMSANDIYQSGIEETREMYNSVIGFDIIEGEEVSSIKKETGETLRVLSGSKVEVEQTLKNFGLSSENLSENFLKKLITDDLSKKAQRTVISLADTLQTETSLNKL